MPLPTDSIDPLPCSGQANDFSGGCAIGDTVADFHLWSLNGAEFVLSNEVEADKPTIIFNGSITCIRFQNDWNPMVTPEASLNGSTSTWTTSIGCRSIPVKPMPST